LIIFSHFAFAHFYLLAMQMYFEIEIFFPLFKTLHTYHINLYFNIMSLICFGCTDAISDRAEIFKIEMERGRDLKEVYKELELDSDCCIKTLMTRIVPEHMFLNQDTTYLLPIPGPLVKPDLKAQKKAKAYFKNLLLEQENIRNKKRALNSDKLMNHLKMTPNEKNKKQERKIKKEKKKAFGVINLANE
jgi:DNA-directed RNA polymerase subunit N (RpoN/RPB10)